MMIAKNYTEYINPQQIAVGCSDQPLYALKKKIQWACPQQLSNQSYFAFMGGLHIEQAALKVHGELLQGTGLDDIVQHAGMATVGLKTAVCDVNDIKKARYTVQVLASCLYKLLWNAYIESGGDNFDDWVKAQDSAMFKYWYGILDHQVTILMLVCSFREADLILFISTLKR